METNTRVDGLIDRWEALHQQGSPLTIQELCANCPELIAEVRRRIAALRAMDLALDTAETGCLPTPEARAGSQGAGFPRGLPEVLQATAVYRPRRHHDQGGLRGVFTAHQEELGRTVALTRLRPDRLRDMAPRRFLHEAAPTARHAPRGQTSN
jgi:hypothetical protein